MVLINVCTKLFQPKPRNEHVSSFGVSFHIIHWKETFCGQEWSDKRLRKHKETFSRLWVEYAYILRNCLHRIIVKTVLQMMAWQHFNSYINCVCLSKIAWDLATYKFCKSICKPDGTYSIVILNELWEVGWCPSFKIIIEGVFVIGFRGSENLCCQNQVLKQKFQIW